MLSSASTSAFACPVCNCVGFLQMPSLNDVDNALLASCPPAESVTLTDMDDAPSPSPATSSSGGDWNDVSGQDVPSPGMVQLKAGFIRLYQLVTALVVQITAIASDIVSLKGRVTAVEGAQTLALVHGQHIEALARRVNELHRCVASQEDRIVSLEYLQRAETESCKRTAQELTAKLDDNKARDDAVENLRQSFKNLQQSMECQAARITGVRADTARKISLLQSEMAGVQTDLAAVKTAVSPINASTASHIAKEARKARILASVAQRMEDAEMAEEVERICPLPPIVSRNPACTSVLPMTLTSMGGSPVTHPNYSKTEEIMVSNLSVNKGPITIVRTSEIPATPIPTERKTPMGRNIPTAKGSDKENKPSNNSTTILQYTKTFWKRQAGRSVNITDNALAASPRRFRPGTGLTVLTVKASALPQPRRSMVPAPRKQRYTKVGDEVKAACSPARRSETRTVQPKTVGRAPIATSRSLLENLSPTLVEKERRFVLPASSSLRTLETALQAMQLDSDDLLAPIGPLSCSNDDLSFSVTSPTFTKLKRNHDDKYENIHVPPKQKIKPLKSPLKSRSMRIKNKVLLPTSSSLTALDAALQVLQGEVPGSEYSGVDFSFSATRPVLLETRLCRKRRESIYASPMRTLTVKPSRRL